MMNCLVVGVGGFLGSVVRYLFGLIPIRESSVFPVNTLFINVIGAFLIGFIAAESLNNQNINPHLVLLLKVGLCGGFTTFSTFSLETMDLIKGGNHVVAFIYVSCSILLCMAATMTAQIIVSR